jgi:opacity protein-like surface antigen
MERPTMRAIRLAALALAMAVKAAPLEAQTTGGFASIGAAATSVEDATRAALTAGMGYRFTSTVGVGMDLTFVPRIKPELPAIVPLDAAAVAGIPVPVPTLAFTAERGRATLFTVNLRLEPPTHSTRVAPYMIGGGGYGSVTERWRETIAYPIAVTNVVIPTFIESFSRTTSGFAVALGGGVSIAAGSHLSVDGDARYIGLLGDRELHIGRFGAGLTYRF